MCTFTLCILVRIQFRIFGWHLFSSSLSHFQHLHLFAFCINFPSNNILEMQKRDVSGRERTRLETNNGYISYFHGSATNLHDGTFVCVFALICFHCKSIIISGGSISHLYSFPQLYKSIPKTSPPHTLPLSGIELRLCNLPMLHYNGNVEALTEEEGKNARTHCSK